MRKVKKISKSDNSASPKSPILSHELEGKSDFSTKSEIESVNSRGVNSLNNSTLLKYNELNQAMTKFISLASHKFRTPLTSILASADLLEIYGRKWTQEKYMEHIEKIQRSVLKMTTLLDDALVIGNSERDRVSISPEKVNLKLALQNIVSEQGRVLKPKQIIKLNFLPKREVFCLDKKLVGLAIGNLLSNAIKFSGEASVITLTSRIARKELVLSVVDSGIGIPKNEIEEIFHPFYRCINAAGIAGSGLGLAVVKEIVELLGGTIEVDSAIERGTKITLILQES